MNDWRDRVAIALCTMGSVVIAFGAPASPLLWRLAFGAAAFVGVHLVTRRGAPLAALALATVGTLLASTWELLPNIVLPDSMYDFAHESPILHAVPGTLGDTARDAALVVLLWSARERIGGALAAIASASVGIAIAARILALPFLAGFAALEPSPIGLAVRAIESGWQATACMLAGAALLVVALAPTVAAAERRRGLLVGAIGGALTLAVLEGFPNAMPTSRSAAEILVGSACVTLAIAWLLLAAGTIALGRQSTAERPAWIATAGICAQILACVPTMFLLDQVDARLDRAPLLVGTIALLGLAVAAFAMRGTELVPLLRVTGGVLAVATLGGCCVPFTLFAATTELVRLQIEEPFWTLAHLTRVAAPTGLAGWITYLALRASPPDGGRPLDEA